MIRSSRFLLAAVLLLWRSAPAAAQDQPGSATRSASSSLDTRDLRAGFSATAGGFAVLNQLDHSIYGARTTAATQASSGTPRWVKWGLVGAASGAVLFSIAGQSNPDGNRSAAGDAALGAAIGFAILGGAIALYDSVCSPDSGSRRAGLCGR